MITFYPRDIGLWRKVFEFSSSDKAVWPFKVFGDRDDLIGFCKRHGVRLDDQEHPFTITGPSNHPVFGEGTYSVNQWSCLGWIKDF